MTKPKRPRAKRKTYQDGLVAGLKMAASVCSTRALRWYGLTVNKVGELQNSYRNGHVDEAQAIEQVLMVRIEEEGSK